MADPNGKPEHRPLAGCAFDRDLAAHGQDQTLADRESEAGAAVAARGRDVGLHEWPEQPFDIGRRHADARIGDGKPQPQAAALGAAILLYSGSADAFSFLLPLAAMTGALASILLVWLVAGQRGGLVTLLLAGLAVASLAGAGTALTINLSPNPFAVTEIVFWLMGSFEDRSMRHVTMALPFMIGACAVLLRTGPALRALALGDDTAASLGIALPRLRLMIVAAVAVGVGAGVAVSGAIGFIGLMAPHLVRGAVDGDPGRTLLPSALAGAVLLILSDIAVRLVPSASELKVGVLTVCIGVPFFLWLVASGRATFGEARS